MTVRQAMTLSLGLHAAAVGAAAWLTAGTPDRLPREGAGPVRSLALVTVLREPPALAPAPGPVAEPQPLTPLRLPLPVVEAAPPPVPPRVTVARAAPQAVPTAPSWPESTPEPATDLDEPVGAATDRPGELWRVHQPAYPMQARRRGEEGVVTVRVEVDAQGAPVDARVAESSGYRALDQAAILAVRQSHFGAARNTRDEILLTFRFRLED